MDRHIIRATKRIELANELRIAAVRPVVVPVVVESSRSRYLGDRHANFTGSAHVMRMSWQPFAGCRAAGHKATCGIGITPATCRD